MDINVEKRINMLIAAYNKVVGGIDNRAMHSTDRAYGGIIRAGKGKLLETMTAELVNIAWEDVLHQNQSRLKINKEKMPVTVNENYISRIKDTRVKEYVKTHRRELVYKFGTDVQVFIDNKLVLPIECKSYTENAMIKRILFDAELMFEIARTPKYYLVQLESMLGGDYCELNDVTFGSPATHALLSHVDIDLEIITLLKGERKVDQPIHKKEFFKELHAKELEKAIHIFADALKKYATSSSFTYSFDNTYGNLKVSEAEPTPYRTKEK